MKPHLPAAKHQMNRQNQINLHNQNNKNPPIKEPT
jgi:hypothetical protein